MTGLIEAFQEIDTYLAQSIRSGFEPLTLLEDIETGSLRVWLRNVLTTVDDESLRSGDWKKVVGAFLVKAKRIMVDWTTEHTEISSEADLTDLQQRILDEAARTGVLHIPMYSPIPTSQIAKSVELIADATRQLRPGDSVSFLSELQAPARLNLELQVVPERLSDLLVHESLVNEALMILIIKKPDFLGDSMWEFRHGKGSIPAKLLDGKWLAEFRCGNVVIHPGDALRAKVRSTARYGYDGDVIDLQYEVVHVEAVINAIRPTQEGLFPRG